jgi:hypothetical protein
MIFTFEELSSSDEFNSSSSYCPQGNMFCRQPWIDFVENNAGGKFIGVKITDDSLRVSFFAGILFKKFGIPILGSPFRGWGTPYMGIFGSIPISEDLVTCLIKFLFRSYKPLYIEIINAPSEERLLSCLDFTVSNVASIYLDLRIGEEGLLSKFKGDCRTYLRQFQLKGGSISIAEPDEKFVDIFYDQLNEVFLRQGMIPTYSKLRVSSLLATLRGGAIDFLCLNAISSDNKIIASSIFFGGNGIFYYWAGASYSKYQHYRPNESMIWYAIKYFIELGYHSFDMIGVRNYKLKFSPETIHYNKITATPYRFLTFLRNFSEKVFFILNKSRGWWAGRSNYKENLKLSSNLYLKSIERFERVHLNTDELQIFSKRNLIFMVGARNHKITLPITRFKRMLSSIRIFRRILRLDKLNIVVSASGYIVFWQGSIYHWSENFGLRHKMTLKSCRNLMQNCIATIDELTFVFGEYGGSNEEGKNIYRTRDGGLTWEILFKFSASMVDHIHSCRWDKLSERLWIFSGDENGKCWIISASLDFEDIRYFGDGTQTYRATGAFLEEKFIHWIMDSPTTNVRHVKMNKITGEIEFAQSFPGPVYYYSKTRDGVYLVCTAQEPGSAVSDEFVHIYASRNLKKWTDVGRFSHDGLPMSLFRFGVGIFPEGDFLSSDFLLIRPI